MGLLDDFTEYARRSGRNLGGLFDYLGDSAATQNQAAKDGAKATAALLQGAELTPEQRDAFNASPAAGFGTDAGGGGAMALMYAGPKAATANLKKLGQAQRMIERGQDAEHTRKTTGWFQDPTGDWKFEISDHKAAIRPNADGTYKLEHPDLRRAYPDMVDTMRIEKLPAMTPLGQPNMTLGEYHPSRNLVKLHEGLLNADPDQARRALLHEVQHGVQDREGFSPGTAQNSDEIGQMVNTEYWPKYEQLEKDILATRRERETWLNTHPGSSLEDFYKTAPDWPERMDGLLDQRMKFPGINDWTFKKYNAALGEVEARDTMERRNLTPDERRQFPPYATILQHDNIPWTDIWDIRKVAEQMKPQTREMREAPDPAPQLLDLTPEGRARRAEAQGYTVDAYKGDAVDRPSLDNPDAPYAGFFSSDPAVANRFAEGYGQSYGGDPSAGVVYPAKLKMQNPYVIDAQGKHAADLQFGRGGKEFRDALENPDYDGVILRNTADEGEVYVPKTPQQVRSRFANFDPARTADPSLLAGIVPGGLLALGSSDDTPKRRKRGLLDTE